MTMIDFEGRPDEEVKLIIKEGEQELTRRALIDHETVAISKIQWETADSLGIAREHGSDWVEPIPGDRTTLYQKGEVVRFESRLHMSLIPYNHLTPDVAAPYYNKVWRTLDWDPNFEYTAPAIVTLDGKTYELIGEASDPGWRPDDPDFSDVWAEVTP